jgi:hypothetical protein
MLDDSMELYMYRVKSKREETLKSGFSDRYRHQVA